MLAPHNLHPFFMAPSTLIQVIHTAAFDRLYPIPLLLGVQNELLAARGPMYGLNALMHLLDKLYELLGLSERPFPYQVVSVLNFHVCSVSPPATWSSST